MDTKKWASLEARARIIKAVAHPARLFIVEELKRGERCVCELTDMLGFDTSTVSKHLSVLDNAGIVEHRKSGTNCYYSLRVPCILEFLGCVEEVMESNLKGQRELVMTCRKR
ncbi:MAG: ArsR family transcriptional regulator [Spirochaetes bacterium]|nr:MAG: ArsR family transcriptional regulator [Spirochaetota bacterium]